MNKQSQLSIFGYFKYFKNIIGWHVYGYIVINFLVGFLDGLGLTMFIPLLTIATGNDVSKESLGSLQFLVQFIEDIGLELNLVNVLMFMIGLFILKGIIHYLRIIYFTRIRIHAIRKIRFNLLSGLNNLSYSAFTQAESGKIQNNIINYINMATQALTHYFNSFQHTIMLLTYVSMAFASNWQFAIMIGIGGALTNFLYRYIGIITKRLAKQQIYLGNDFNGLLIQAINNFKYLKATNNLKKYEYRLKNIQHKTDNNDYRMSKIGGISEGLREPVIIIIIALVLIIQLEVIGSDFGSILVSLLLFYRGLAHLVTLQGYWNYFLRYSAGVESIEELKSEFTQNQESINPQNKIEHIKEIDVKNINVSYGGTPVLKNLSFHIKNKTSIALVGESGAGKTTLANVVCGLLQPNNGEILTGNQSLYDSDLASFRNKVGYITQEPVIFDDTLFNNITFWGEKTPENMEKFLKVINMVSLNKFYEGLENKEETRLGNNGILVSGGQKQRISIARELYKDVELLIMDEATSALDSETEKHIKDNIDMLHGQFTMIIIAHRLSTIKNVDEIFLMDKGEIIASGSYTELLQKSERFRKMVELQEV